MNSLGMVVGYYPIVLVDQRNCCRHAHLLISNMQITLYKSKICPRCFIAKKRILELISTLPEINYKEIDVVISPLQSWNDGIRMIPAIKIENEILSGTLLSKLQMSNFINKYKQR